MAFYLWVLCVVNLAPSTVYCITSTGAPKLLISGMPWQREMKSSDCGDEEFFHNGFCCDKCSPGYFMRSPCVDSHKKTLCGPCPPSSYNALPNYARSCRRCTQCYTDFGQIMLQECLQIQDTQCGCPEGMYHNRDDKYFSCLDCANVPVGMLSPAKCKMSSTTATTTSGSCREGWFGTDRCFPCTRCKREKHPCNGTSDAICDSTSTSDLQLAWLALLLLPLLLVVLIITCRTLLCPRLHSFIKAAGRRQKVLVAEETQAVSGRGSHTLVVTGQAAGRGWSDGSWHGAVGDTNGVGEPLISPSEGRSSPLRGETSLLVDVTNEEALPILDQPLCLKALYAVSAVVPVRRWNEFVRHLGLNDSAITDASRDNPGNTSEARAEMLRVWKRARGRRATARCICNTLRSMGLDGCAEEVEVQLQG